MSGPEYIRALKKYYTRQKITSYGLVFLAFTVFLIALYSRWEPANSFGLILLFTWLSGGLLLLGEIRKKQRIAPEALARHLNRTQPELQESGLLLLTQPEDLNLLERLQLRRIMPLLATTNPRQAIKVSYRNAWLAILLSLLLSGVIFLIPNLPQAAAIETARPALPDNQTKAIRKVLPQIKAITIQVTPPAYTHLAAYTIKNLNFKVETGSRITWNIRTKGPVNTFELTIAEKQNHSFRKLKNTPDTYTVSFIPAGSFIYSLDLNKKKSDLYAVELLADQNPMITIQKPKPYTELSFGDPQNVTIAANLTDDYGLRKANLVSTIAQGAGESVKFREMQSPINLGSFKTPRKLSFRKNIDLKALGMTYGDELYFYIQVWDNHRGYARSETYLVQLQDTTLETNGAGLSLRVSALPAYFRSQRQLILDTEKLLREKKELSPTAFRERSNNLGADQKLLRLRYGKFLGEESETVTGANPAEGHHDEDGHDHSTGLGERNKSEELLDPYIHKHDTEEDATYFEPAVKAQLKAALAQMWEAELHLRLAKPEAALPFEYRALRLLKEVQQKSRAYVRKMGFDPPPIKEAEKRLTGDLGNISGQTNQENRRENEQFPAIREALPWLTTQKPGQRVSAQKAHLLQQAGGELARVATHHPTKYLAGLRDLRKLITEVQAGKITCSSCLASVAATFEQVLPKPTTSPAFKSIPRHALARQYFRNIK